MEYNYNWIGDGEIVDYNAAIKILETENETILTSKDLNRSEKELLLKSNGWVDPKENFTFNWNKNKGNAKFFYKGYKTFQKEVIMDLNMNELGLMTILSMYLESQTNKVIINCESPTNEVLETLTKLGETTVKKTLSSLKNKNLIVTKGRGTGREIYLNPYWAFDGNNISNETLELFNI